MLPTPFQSQQKPTDILILEASLLRKSTAVYTFIYQTNVLMLTNEF